MYSLPQKFVAEFIGTFAVVFICAGSICADQYLISTGQNGLGSLGLALSYGLAYAVMVTAVGHISGAHLNPAVTIGFWVTKRMGTIQSLCYWIAQLSGSLAAAYLIKVTVPDDIWVPKALGSITPDLGGDFTRSHGMALEALMTFFLVFIFFATVADVRGAFDKVGGFAVGMAITVGVLLGSPFTGAAMNPARAFGPALAFRHWQNHGVYWVGPLVGGVLAGFIYDRVFLRDQPAA
jgi:MIP family channel proteins